MMVIIENNHYLHLFSLPIKELWVHVFIEEKYFYLQCNYISLNYKNHLEEYSFFYSDIQKVSHGHNMKLI